MAYTVGRIYKSGGFISDNDAGAAALLTSKALKPKDAPRAAVVFVLLYSAILRENSPNILYPLLRELA